MDLVFRVVLVVAVIVGTLMGGLWSLRTDFIYFFDATGSAPAEMPRTRVETLPGHAGAPPLTLWVTEPETPSHPVVVYFMGDTGSLSVHEARLRPIAGAGMGIVAMAYRGGGGQPGVPSEDALYHDALRAYAAVDTAIGRPVPDTKRVIWGFSLGTGLAARLASEQEELAVILEAPFTRLCDADNGLGGMLPGCLLMKGSEYEVQEYIADVGAPLLILHGTADDQVPVSQARTLFDMAAEPKFIEIYPGGGHENLGRFGADEDALSFIRVLAGIR